MSIEPDVLRKIALSLPMEEVYEMCKSNALMYNAICGSDDFWRPRLVADFGKEWLPTMYRAGIYRERYVHLRRDLGWYIMDAEMLRSTQLGGKDQVLFPSLGGTLPRTTRLTADLKQVSCRGDTVYILEQDGTLWGKGYNAYHQIDSSGKDWIEHFIKMDTPPTGVSQISNGGSYVCIVDNNGLLWGRGSNAWSQIRSPSSTFMDHFHDPRGQPGNIVSVYCGGTFVLALGDDNRVWGAGSNWYGVLGPRNNQTGFREIYGIDFQVAKISCGSMHAMFLDTSGNLRGIGSNRSGQLGITDATETDTPVLVAENVADVSCSHDKTLILDRDGDVWSMGENIFQGAKGISLGKSAIMVIDVHNNLWTAKSSNGVFIKHNITAWAAESGGAYISYLGFPEH